MQIYLYFNTHFDQSRRRIGEKETVLKFWEIAREILCPPLNRMTLDQHNTHCNNQMITLTCSTCELLRCNGIGNIIEDFYLWSNLLASTVIF